MKQGTKRARDAKRARTDEPTKKQGKQGKAKQANVVRRAAVGDGIGPSTY